MRPNRRRAATHCEVRSRVCRYNSLRIFKGAHSATFFFQMCFNVLINTSFLGPRRQYTFLRSRYEGSAPLLSKKCRREGTLVLAGRITFNFTTSGILRSLRARKQIVDSHWYEVNYEIVQASLVLRWTVRTKRMPTHKNNYGWCSQIHWKSDFSSLHRKALATTDSPPHTLTTRCTQVGVRGRSPPVNATCLSLSEKKAGKSTWLW